MAAVRRGLTVAGALVAAWAAAAVALDAAGEPSGAASGGALVHAVVVLGCAPKADGALSWCLERRTGEAVRAWRAGRAPRVVITGGAEGGGPTEASVAARFARKLGVPAERLMVGEHATSTRDNALEVRALLGPPPPEGWEVVVVTDRPHCWRAVRTFEAAGLRAGCLPVVLPATARAGMAAREVAAVATYAAQGWL